MKKIIFFTIIAFLLVSVSITSISAQSQYQIPSWVKGIANFWVEGNISDSDFGEAITFLIDQQILKISIIEQLQNENAQLKAENLELRSQLDLPDPTPEPEPKEVDVPDFVLQLNTIVDKTIEVEKTITFTASITDSQITDEQFSLDKQPSGATINKDTGAFTWTPTKSQGNIQDVGYSFDIIAKSGSQEDKETVTITVKKAYVEPTIMVTISTDQDSYDIGDSISVKGLVRNYISGVVTLVVSNPEGDTVTLDQLTPRTNGLFTSNYLTGSTFDSSGTYQITVNHKGVTATSTFEFTNNSGIQNSIDVTADKASYSEGEIVRITGKVRDLYSGTPVSVVIIDPNGDLVSMSQVQVSTDKKFSTEFTAGGGLMAVKGTYTITAQYGTENRSAQTTFEFEGITRITLSSDVNIIANGGTVKISGNIEPYDSTFAVSYVIITPDEKERVGIGQLLPKSDGSFEFSFVAGGPLWKTNGDYIVEVKYGADKNTTLINYVGGN